MNMKVIITFVVAVALTSTVQAQYNAAVVEYSPIFETTPSATVERNLEEYLHYIETAKANSVDIIVFPEYGLTGLVEDPAEYAIEIPTINNGSVFQNYWLQKLSNAAFEHRLYVVVNLLEKVRNENNDTIYHNTNIVFSKEGQIVAKYRKINLFFEPKITPGNETVSFTTDFGVTFGIFTCFDILYYNPSRSLLNGTSITDIIFPTAWTSVLPFYHSLSIQSGYSQANRVNLLAADYNNPTQGLGGSGIYLHDGTIASYYISGISSSKLLVSTVYPRGTPREGGRGIFSTFGFDILNASQSELKNFITVRDFQSSNYAFRQLDLSTSEIQETLCFGPFCCNFQVSVSSTNSSEIYQLLVYNGPTKLGESEGNIRFCAVVSCESTDQSTCGSRNVTHATKFSKLSISGTFEAEPDHFYQPVTLTTGLLPVFNTTFTSEATNQSISTSFNSTTTAENLVVFGILGRGGAPAFGSSVLFLVAISLIKYMF